MARPEKNNANYFSHDNNMRNDQKLKAVRKKFGHEGFSIYNMLLEKLTETEHFILTVNELNLELWAGDFEIEIDKLTSMIDYFVKVELLQRNENEIKSTGLIKRLLPLVAKRNRTRNKFQTQELQQNVVMDVENTQSKVKEIKVEEIKKNKSKKDNNNISSETSSEVPIQKIEEYDFPEGDPIKVTHIPEAEEKKEESSGKEEKKPPKEKTDLYSRMVAVYNQFYFKRTELPAKIDGMEGKALKSIIAYFKTASKDKSEDGIVNSWKHLLDSWDKLDEFTQNQLRITDINSKMGNIVAYLKKNKKNKIETLAQQSNDIADYYRKQAESGANS